MQALLRLCELYPAICLTTEEKARKNLSQGSRRVPAVTMKIYKHTITIHRHNNKNTDYGIKQECNHMYIDKGYKLKNTKECDNIKYI